MRRLVPPANWTIPQVQRSSRTPPAAGVFEPFGLTSRPEIAAISMPGSSVLVAVNALALKTLCLPHEQVVFLTEP